MFESLVNSDRYQTLDIKGLTIDCLRALLIQIGIKHIEEIIVCRQSLRALLIQIGIKLQNMRTE